MAKNFKTILLATLVAGFALVAVSGLQYAQARLSNTSPIVNTAGFLTSPVTDADVPDTITVSNYLLLAGGTMTGNLVGTGASFSNGIELTGDKRLAINAGAFTDTSFEVGGTASISGAVTLKGAVTGATSYNGLVITADTGAITTGTWSGTTIDEAKIDWVVTGQVIDFSGATSFKIPGASAPSITASGLLSMHTGSKSLDWGDGTSQEIIRRNGTCILYPYATPTAATRWGGWRFNDPFTIDTIGVVASGANAATWNLYYGPPLQTGTQGTAVFTAPKSASTSSNPTYGTGYTYPVNNVTILDGDQLDLVISSKSATLGYINIRICGRYNH